MIDFLNEHWWFAILLLAILFSGNLYLSKLSNKFYETYARQHIIFSNDDRLSLDAQKEIKENHLFSAQNFWAFLLIVLLVVNRLIYGKQVFEFFYGALLLALIHFTLRNLENSLQFLDMRNPNSAGGQIEYSHQFIQRISSLRLFSQSIIFGIAAIATMRPFFWGGTLYCLLLSGIGFVNTKQSSQK